MKFFDRESEMARLREIREKTAESARFTVVTGRRRVGKTQLIKRALEDLPYLYFYVARKTEKDLEPFRVSVLKEILATYKPRYTPDDLLSLWTLTGGVARYVELLMDDKATNRKAMIKSVFSVDSPFFDEGMSISILRSRIGKCRLSVFR